MVRVWAGSWGMNYDYESPHKDGTMVCVCVCVLANISRFLTPDPSGLPLYPCLVPDPECDVFNTIYQISH